MGSSSLCWVAGLMKTLMKVDQGSSGLFKVNDRSSRLMRGRASDLLPPQIYVFFVYFAKPHAYKKQHPMHLHTRRKIVVPRSTKLAWTSLVWFFWEGSCTSLPQEDVCAACVFQGHDHLDSQVKVLRSWATSWAASWAKSWATSGCRRSKSVCFYVYSYSLCLKACVFTYIPIALLLILLPILTST